MNETILNLPRRRRVFQKVRLVITSAVVCGPRGYYPVVGILYTLRPSPKFNGSTHGRSGVADHARKAGGSDSGYPRSSRRSIDGRIRFPPPERAGTDANHGAGPQAMIRPQQANEGQLGTSRGGSRPSQAGFQQNFSCPVSSGGGPGDRRDRASRCRRTSIRGGAIKIERCAPRALLPADPPAEAAARPTLGEGPGKLWAPGSWLEARFIPHHGRVLIRRFAPRHDWIWAFPDARTPNARAPSAFFTLPPDSPVRRFLTHCFQNPFFLGIRFAMV
jgi:hypothetical protein